MAMRILLLLTVLALIVAGIDIPAAAQVTFEEDPGSAMQTRRELEELVAFYTRVMESPAYSASVKEATQAKMDRIRERLSVGDFEVGDRIALSVQGEVGLPAEVTVRTGPKITLPLFGDISLSGILRSEVEAHLTQELSAYIHDPVVTAEPMLRISVQGAVGQPGFYIVPADQLLGETLMVAGGPGTGSDMDGLRIERGSGVVMEGHEVQEALRLGLTLDQLSLQAGDQLVVPESRGGMLGNVGMIAGLVGSLSLLLLRIF